MNLISFHASGMPLRFHPQRPRGGSTKRGGGQRAAHRGKVCPHTPPQERSYFSMTIQSPQICALSADAFLFDTSFFWSLFFTPHAEVPISGNRRGGCSGHTSQKLFFLGKEGEGTLALLFYSLALYSNPSIAKSQHHH